MIVREEFKKASHLLLGWNHGSISLYLSFFLYTDSVYYNKVWGHFRPLDIMTSDG
jgi:hypothetical protein